MFMHLNQISRKHLLIHLYPRFVQILHVAELTRFLTHLSDSLAIIFQRNAGSICWALSIDNFGITAEELTLVFGQPHFHHI